MSDSILAALSTTWVCAPACCQLNKAGLGGSLQQQQQHPSRDALVFCFSFLSSNEVSVPPGLARSRPAGSTTDAVCSPEPRLISQIRRLCCRAETELCCRASLTSVSSSSRTTSQNVAVWNNLTGIMSWLRWPRCDLRHKHTCSENIRWEWRLNWEGDGSGRLAPLRIILQYLGCELALCDVTQGTESSSRLHPVRC